MGPKKESEKININNEGEVYSPNRAARRRKPQKPRTVTIDYVQVPSNIYTKDTHKIKKLRSRNAKKNNRKLTKARKSRKENYSQIS